MNCTNCNEDNSAVRRKLNRAQRYQYGQQCLTCGRLVGVWMKHSEVFDAESVPEWDELLQAEWWSRHWAELTAKRENDRQDWLASHSKYLRTEAWGRRRRRVLERSEGLCEGCRERAAAHVHHLSYAHWQEELLYELVALCEPCHEKAHAKATA